MIDVIAKKYNIKLPEKCEKDRFIPDVMVVCDRTIDTIRGITGPPSLIVEVVSRGTAVYDSTIKKEVYALIGVKEYWIADPYMKSVVTYVLKDGAYDITGEYYKYTPGEIKDIEEEKEFLKKGWTEIITEFSPYYFPDLTISIDDVFDDLIE